MPLRCGSHVAGAMLLISVQEKSRARSNVVVLEILELKYLLPKWILTTFNALP
jgi:hypothetical protein